ncbi:MAG: protein-S-isoprenylcysteine O-methyltransferase Ste14 [Planctomycetota bacterium]|jgi:protein-S-isoprenylcysteine O-methyltransferase Ste14/predicted DCC family thiol-disulfide oxidoreductase YuxK
MSLRDWMLEHSVLLRSSLFLCCVGWMWIMLAWLRPSAITLRRSALAALVHLGLGILLDVLIQRAGGWRYRDLGFALGGVPLDLHFDWTLIWGLGMIWLLERWPGLPCSNAKAGAYVFFWICLTTLFDLTIHQWMLFLESWSSYWYLWDIGFLTVVFFTTLWLYASIGKRAGEPTGFGSLRAIPPFTRSLLYLACLLPLIFCLMPIWFEALAVKFVGPIEVSPIPVVPGLLAFVAFGLGGWAVREFALMGEGTPIPWDAPRRVVDTGPYAFVRNPMQISGLLLCLALFSYRPSWINAVYLIHMAMFAGVVFTLIEPPVLAERFGSSWKRYCQSARLFIPRTKRAVSTHDEQPIVFIDGDCSMCQNGARWILSWDNAKSLQIAPVGGSTYVRLIGDELDSVDSMILYEPRANGTALVSIRSAAALRTISYAPMPWALLSSIEGLPGTAWLRNLVYRFVARIRLKLSRGFTACPLNTLRDSRLLP